MSVPAAVIDGATFAIAALCFANAIALAFGLRNRFLLGGEIWQSVFLGLVMTGTGLIALGRDTGEEGLSRFSAAPLAAACILLIVILLQRLARKAAGNR